MGLKNNFFQAVAELGEIIGTTEPEEEKIPPMVLQNPQMSQEITTIPRGTVIEGEIIAEGDVELIGSVKGKVHSQGDIRVTGKVVGDVIGKNIQLKGSSVKGNIEASGFVTVDTTSIVIGNVKAENFNLEGKMEGTAMVEKEVKFQSQAILSGNVTTESIAISQGARIQGEVHMSLAEKESNTSMDTDIII